MGVFLGIQATFRSKYCLGLKEYVSGCTVHRWLKTHFCGIQLKWNDDRYLKDTMIQHYSCGAAFNKNTVDRTQEKLKLQSISRTSYSWILNRSTTDHRNNSRTQELTSFFSRSPTHQGVYFTFAVSRVHYRNMSRSYWTPLRECKTYRDQVLLHHHELESIRFSALTWR